MSKLHRIAVEVAAGGHIGADVVFVHGLGGDPFATWEHGEPGTASWPNWLAQEFPEVAVWSLGYAASPTKWARVLRIWGRGDRNSGHSMSLPDRANQVLDSMVLEGLGQRPLIYVCHSLGGLLVKQVLRKAVDSPAQAKRNVADKTCGVLFLATPHNGAVLANLADAFRKLLGATVSIQDLREHDAHLRDLYDWYRNHATRMQLCTITYYEGRNVNGIARIVNPTSAHPGVGEDPVQLDEDHVSIAKPRSASDQVCRALRQLVREQALVSPKAAQLAVNDRGKTSYTTWQSAASAIPIVVRVETAPQLSGAHHRPPRELPSRATQFLGRAPQRAALADRLRRGLNSAVVGAGGLGKTALTAEALVDVVGARCERLHESQFSDGIVYLDLYARGGMAEPIWNDLATRIAGVGFMEQSPAHSRAREACRGRALLVVIEGGEEADGQAGRASIHELLGVLSPENRWLLLTRSSTQANPVDTIELLHPLDADDAERLLNAITAGVDVSGESRADVLALLEGHPLALNWAGNLLARGDEVPAALVRSWKESGLPPLSDPTRSEHTLHWLFERSRRKLSPLAGDCLALAGLIAHAPFPAELVLSGLNPETSGAKHPAALAALKQLIQYGLLRRQGEQEFHFAHVLPYRFARDGQHRVPDGHARMAAWLRAQALSVLSADLFSPVDGQWVARLIEHAAALLRSSPPHTLWSELGKPLLYDIADRLADKGRVDLRAEALAAVTGWFERLSSPTLDEASWSRENSVRLNAIGALRRDQGDLGGALAAFRDALAIRQRLASADSSNAAWQRDLSVSHNNVGNVLRDQGDLAGALAAFRDSLAIRQRLASADASNATWQRDLCVSHNNVGKALRDQGDLAGALAAFRDSLAISQRLASADASNADWQRALSVSHNNVGNVLRDQGDLAGALAAFRDSLAIRQRLASADASNAAWQRDLSVSHNNVGKALCDQGDLAGALAAFRDSLAISQRLASADASNAAWQRDLSVSHNNVGNVLRDQGDLAGALAAFRDSLAISQRLASADASNAAWQRDLGVSHDSVGNVLRDQGDLAGALAAFRDSLAISQRLASADASNAAWQRDLSVSHNNVGNVLRDQGDLAGALAAFRDSLAISQRLANADASNAAWQRDLSVSHNNVGNVLRDQGDLAGALAAFRDSLAISQRLANADASNAAWQRDLSVSHNNVGNVLHDQGDLAGALAAFRDSLAISQRLASADASNAAWQRDLSVSHDNVGNVLHDQGDLAGALAAFRDSLAIRQRLASADASNAAWQRDLSVSHDNVGNVLRDQGDPAGALAAFRDSLAISQRLASADASNAAWQRDLSVSHNNVGNVLRDQGDLAGALAAFRDSLTIRQRLASADASNAAWQRDLSYTLTLLAKLREAEDERSSALDFALRSLVIDEQLARLDPTNATWQRDLAVSRALVARLQDQ